MCDRRPTSKRRSGLGSRAAVAGWPCTAPTARSTHRSARARPVHRSPRLPGVGRHAGEPVRLAPTDRAVPRRPVTGRRRGPARRRHRAVRVGRRAVPDGASRRRRAPAGDALDGNHAWLRRGRLARGPATARPLPAPARSGRGRVLHARSLPEPLGHDPPAARWRPLAEHRPRLVERAGVPGDPPPGDPVGQGRHAIGRSRRPEFRSAGVVDGAATSGWDSAQRRASADATQASALAITRR